MSKPIEQILEPKPEARPRVFMPIRLTIRRTMGFSR